MLYPFESIKTRALRLPPFLDSTRWRLKEVHSVWLWINKIERLKSRLRLVVTNSFFCVHFLNLGHPPFFGFSVECVSWCWVGRSDWKLKSRNRRPWYPRMTLKVNIHIVGLTKCTMYCKKCSCFCACFSLCSMLVSQIKTGAHAD